MFSNRLKSIGIELGNSAKKFFFAPSTSYPFEVLRIGVSLVLLVQLFFTSRVIFEIYGEGAFLQRGIQEFFGAGLLEINALSSALERIGVAETTTILSVALLYGTSLLAMMLGLATRVASIIAWLTHVILFQGNMSSYGVDGFAQIGLFYLAISPAGRALAMDNLIRRTPRSPMVDNSFVLRIAQLHLSIAYFASGFEKANGIQWWNGEAIWRSLMLPIYRQFDMGFLSHVPWLAALAGWGTLLVEMGYPVFMNWKRTRPLWVALVVSLHLGIAIFLGLHLFGFFMCVLSISLFGVPSEPKFAWGKIFKPLQFKSVPSHA